MTFEDNCGHEPESGAEGGSNWRDEKLISISIADEITFKNWDTINVSLETFIAMQMNHQEREEKGGPAYTPAALAGSERKKAAATRIRLATLDCDCGDDLDRVVKRMKELGLEGTVCSSHSHKTTKTKINFDDYTKRFGAVTLEDVTRYLTEVKGYLPDALGEVSIVHACKHAANGVFIVVKHAPIQKGRISIVLKKDFVLAEQMLERGITVAQVQGMWALYLHAIADLLAVKLDPACTDVSRAYFWPTHAPGADYFAAHVEGDPLDLDTLKIEMPTDEKGSRSQHRGAKPGKSNTNADPALAKFAARSGKAFQLADLLVLLASDKVRGKTSSVAGVTVQCPFDAHHSDPGNLNDKGCFAINASDSTSGGFVWKCQHAGCQDYDRLDFLQEAINQGWFSMDDVLAAVAGSTGYDFDEPCEAAQKLAAALDRAAETMAKQAVFEHLKCCDNKLIHAEVFKLLKEKVSMGLGDSRAYLNDLIRKAKLAAAKEGGRPHYYYQSDEYGEIVEGVAGVLEQENGKNPRLYRMANNIVRLAVDPATGATVIEPMTKAMLRQEINQLVRFTRVDGEVTKSVSCPGDVADDLLNDPSLALPTLVAVVDAPYFDAEGNIVYTPGYHPESLVWYQPRPGFVAREVSLTPTAVEIADAVALINEVIGEFPYADGTPGNRSSKAHAICFMIEGFARLLIGGSTPIYLVQKPTPGTGASLFVNAVSHVNSGGVGIPQVEVSDANEFRKNLTATLMNGVNLFWLDNVHHKVDNPSWALATTTEVWRDRILGGSKTAVVPVKCTWCISGNNVELSEELARRCAMIRFDANVERPTERADFRHPDLIGYIRANRPDLVWACLTLIQAWIAAGKPSGGPSLASYERWSQVMGGILHVAGIEGFLENRDEVREVASDDLGPLKVFIGTWWDEFSDRRVPVSCAEGGSPALEGCKSLLDLHALHANELDLGFNAQRREAWPSLLGKCINKVVNRVFDIEVNGSLVRVKVRAERKSGGAVKWLERV